MHKLTNRARGIIVDLQDEHLIGLHLFDITTSGYAATQINDKSYYLHKMILKTELKGDHKNGNKLDNRRDNIRPATNSQNMMNRGKTCANTSGYKGVFKNKSLWMARIKVDGKPIYLGSFTSREEAALYYDIAAKKHHGNFANLNFNLELN